MFEGAIRHAVAILMLVVACGAPQERPAPGTGPALVVAVVAEDDRGREVVVPPALRDAVIDEVSRGGFRLEWSELAGSANKSSHRRMKVLAQQAGGADRLLIETKTSFYTELEGRFRWVVDVKLTVEGARGEESQRFDVPAILNFSHYGDEEALEFSAPAVASEVRRVLSRYREREEKAPEPAGA